MESGRETSRSRDSTRRAPRTSSPAFPDDRRAHAPRPSDHRRFPVEPIRPPPPPILTFNESGKEINLPAIGESGCSRRPTMREKTHRCDASGVRRLLTSLLFDLTRELRAVVACALCVKRAEGVNVQTVGGPALCLVTFPVRRWSINPKSDRRSAQIGGHIRLLCELTSKFHRSKPSPTSKINTFGSRHWLSGLDSRSPPIACFHRCECGPLLNLGTLSPPCVFEGPLTLSQIWSPHFVDPIRACPSGRHSTWIARGPSD